jgi:hypothetical protein
MAADIDEKQYIEHEIDRARNGVSDRIDELDRRLRTEYNPKTLASAYAPQIIAGGAVLGLVVGFGLPKVFRRLVTFGVPLAILALTVKNAREADAIEY